jgi:hypothetical protein
VKCVTNNGDICCRGCKQSSFRLHASMKYSRPRGRRIASIIILSTYEKRLSLSLVYSSFSTLDSKYALSAITAACVTLNDSIKRPILYSQTESTRAT